MGVVLYEMAKYRRKIIKKILYGTAFKKSYKIVDFF